MVYGGGQRALDRFLVKHNTAKMKQYIELPSHAFTLAVIGGSLWYWHAQITDVLEMLEMAYG